MNEFENYRLSKEILEAVRGMGISTPTEIQEKSIPAILEGKDVIGESATGSGKTLAFGCGIIQAAQPEGKLQALILTPTRELAQQVKEVLWKLSRGRNLRIASVYGGVSIEPQIRDLERAHVIVATPGRLLDHLERKTANLLNVRMLVLDEADRMLDMGFIDDVEKIIRACPSNRQTMFFSATIPHEIQGLAQKYLKNPVKVNAEKMVDPSKLRQVYYDVAKNMKLSLLAHLLQNEQRKLVMVFCNTRRTAEFVVKNLRTNKLDAIAIHGALSQNKRTHTIQLFNEGKASVLVCTDLAARGLHINNVSHVYNYEIPKVPKDYIHRIGRTARAGDEGKAINILSDYDHDNFSRILREYTDFKIEKLEKPYLKRIIAIRADGTGSRWRGNGAQRSSQPWQNNSTGRSNETWRSKEEWRGNGAQRGSQPWQNNRPGRSNETWKSKEEWRGNGAQRSSEPWRSNERSGGNPHRPSGPRHHPPRRWNRRGRY